jgi:monoamine oxidase
VIVAGAGLAGLAAAERLAREGVEVVVLEARDRVGGRVHSRTLQNGAVVEMGAEFILPGYEVLTGLVERFGLELWSKGMRYGVREPRDGAPVDQRRMHDALETVGRALAARPPDAQPVSAGTLLRDLAIDPAAREVILARVEVSAANRADRVDASALSGLAAHADDESPSVAGGEGQRHPLVAAELGAAVQLRRPVERILWSDEGVRVAAGGAEVEGDAAVVAIPASVLDRVRFEPPLPAPIRTTLEATVYGHAAKLFVPLKAPADPSAVLSVPGRYWTWTATGGGGAVQPVVSAFAGSARALDALGVERGPGMWMKSLRQLRPDLALDRDGAVLSRWDDDPWVRAAYCTPTPGRSVEELTRPIGPLHFCGEHTADAFAALMEGALRSGLRAAADVLRGPRAAESAARA